MNSSLKHLKILVKQGLILLIISLMKKIMKSGIVLLSKPILWFSSKIPFQPKCLFIIKNDFYLVIW